MVIRGRKVNGKITTAVIGLALTSALAWGIWATQGVHAENKKNGEQDEWIKGHEQWTETTLAGVMRDFTRIEERLGKMDKKLDEILKRLSVKP